MQPNALLKVRHPESVALDIPYLEKPRYFYSDLLAAANFVANGTIAKTTADYWVLQVFGTNRPRSVVCTENDFQKWALYLSFWLTFPRSRVNREFAKYTQG
jgi:hypothetical protein